MIEKKDIEKLAQLARIEVPDEEQEVLRNDMENIIEYVSQIKEVMSGASQSEAGEIRNIMREDNRPHEKGIHTKKIMEEVKAEHRRRFP